MIFLFLKVEQDNIKLYICFNIIYSDELEHESIFFLHITFIYSSHPNQHRYIIYSYFNFQKNIWNEDPVISEKSHAPFCSFVCGSYV